jgi:hypothetical protein
MEVGLAEGQTLIDHIAMIYGASVRSRTRQPSGEPPELSDRCVHPTGAITLDK